MKWIVVVLLMGCGKSDECSRAFARLDRLGTTLHGELRRDALEVCRRGVHDPTVQCAMDSESDDAAAACIDKFVKAVLKPGARGGSGINPLLGQ